MNLERRQKYAGSRTVTNSDTQIDINFSIDTLSVFCSYVLSENKNIRKSHLINLRNLFDIINVDLYKNDIEKMKRLNFIKKGLEGKLLKNLNNPALIVKYINGGIIDDDVIDVYGFAYISNQELDWINQTVSEALACAFIYNDIDRMMDICTRFKAADYTSKSAIVKEYENLVIESQTKFRRVKVETQSEMTFTLRKGLMEEVVSDIHEQLLNPSRRLITGMQGINEMLGGGFESGRVYMLLGMTGGGKSLSLLNIAYQLKKYNKNYKAKDPTKIPVIVFLTMENTVKETVQRLFNLVVNDDMENYSVEDAINLLRTDGELYLTDESPIDILIKYVPNRSVDTGYLYTMTEDLEDEGYEVIALIQDHIKRIRSCYPQTDLRIELGAVVNELKIFSVIKDIPVISNSHLNRDGAKTIDEGARQNKADLTRMLGRANIGESMLMLDNLDCAFIINMEYDAEGNKYMVFKRIKLRYKATNRDYICQPFVKGNDIKFIEDYYSAVPLFRDSLKALPNEVSLYNTGLPNSRMNTYNSIKDIDSVLKNNNNIDDNIFSATRYKQSPIVDNNGVIDMVTMPIAIAGRPSSPIRRQAIRFVS